MIMLSPTASQAAGDILNTPLSPPGAVAYRLADYLHPDDHAPLLQTLQGMARNAPPSNAPKVLRSGSDTLNNLAQIERKRAERCDVDPLKAALLSGPERNNVEPTTDAEVFYAHHAHASRGLKDLAGKLSGLAASKELNPSPRGR